MRVISQDGLIDFQYEKMMLYIEQRPTGGVGNYVYDVYATDLKRREMIATYKTKEKALKAMDMLLATYTNFQTYKDNRGNYFAFNYPKLFRFPTDEDLEE